MKDQPIASVLSRRRFEMPVETVLDGLRGRVQNPAGLAGKALDDGKGLLLVVDGVEIAVVYVGAPIPQEMFAAADAGARDAEGLLRDHRDHAMICAVRQTDGREATLRAAMAMLQVAFVLCGARGASAVFWQDAKTLTGVAGFRTMLDPANGMPVGVLARFTPFRSTADGAHGTIGIAALGFGRFIGRDVEFVPKAMSLEDMAARYFQVANWLLREGPVFKDGDTCGLSDAEIIRVRHLDPGAVLPGPVLSFDIEREAALQ